MRKRCAKLLHEWTREELIGTKHDSSTSKRPSGVTAPRIRVRRSSRGVAPPLSPALEGLSGIKIPPLLETMSAFVGSPVGEHDMRDVNMDEEAELRRLEHR